MRTEVAIVALVLAGAALGGCLDDGPVPQAKDEAGEKLRALLEALPLEVDHDHTDVAAHQGAFQMDLVAYNPLNADVDGDWVYGEADVWSHYAFVATLSPRGGFVVVDVADPKAPMVVGRYTAATTYAADIKITPDGQYAILGTQFLFNQGEWLPPAGTPPPSPSSVGINGFQVVSLRDLANPQFVSFLPVEEFGVHMLDVHEIEGETYAFGAPGAGGHVLIARLVEGGGLAQLVPVGKYFMPGGPLDGLPVDLPVTGPNYDLFGPHDVTVYDDPAGSTLMLVAAGVAGVQVVDVSDPMMPKLLGSWRENDGRYVHTVMPLWVNDTRYIVAVPEVFRSAEQQPLWIIDAGAASNMKTVSVWRIPSEEPLGYNSDYRFSTHNINIRDGRIYLSHFHAGAWVLDASTPERVRAPEILGAYIPAQDANLGLGGGLGLASAPLVWDAIPLETGHVLLADIPTGLYIVTDPSVPPEAGDAAAPAPT